MKLLSLETTTDTGSVALHWQNAVLERRAQGSTTHSDWLLPAVGSLLAEAGGTLAQLDAIAVSIGPGSFTGVRLACAVAQGLAVACDKPLIAVPTLQAMAWQRDPGFYLVCVDARMQEVYWSACEVRAEDGGELGGELGARQVIEHLAAGVGMPENLPLPPHIRSNDTNQTIRWTGIGDAFAQYASRMPAAVLQQLAAVDAEVRPSAAAVGGLAQQALAKRQFVDPALLTPLYVRNKVAQTTAERLAAGGRS